MKNVMAKLSERECIPCKGDIAPLKGKDLKNILKQLGNQWKVVNDHHLEKDFLFKNFKGALEFTNKVGALAELQNHHPDIYLAWGKVKITLWTHKIDGLSKSDFILAAKIEELKKLFTADID